MDTEAFFAAIRVAPFGGVISESEIDGTSAILTAWADYFPTGDRRCLAYALGTAFHETGRKMQPVEENLDYSAERILLVFPRQIATLTEARRYARQPEALANRVYGGRLGNGEDETGEGWRYRGRGLAQITGKENYRKASRLVDVDLVHEPEAALEPDTAVAILLLGMAEGLFTGRKLADYFNATTEDWHGARRIISTDRAGLVATHARAFNAALAAAAVRVLLLAAPPMTGADVVAVQEALRRRSISPGPVDGAYGPTTAAAVRRFQGARGLVADGVVGPATRAALGVG